jgi:hypothetical protein
LRRKTPQISAGQVDDKATAFNGHAQGAIRQAKEL